MVDPKHLFQQFVKFGIVGAIAFVIDFGTMVALTELFGVHYLVSATIGFIVSVIFNYLASMRYVFQHRDELDRTREFLIFLILTVVGLGINNTIMMVGVDGLALNYMLVKIFATAVVMVWNFVTRRKFLDAGAR